MVQESKSSWGTTALLKVEAARGAQGVWQGCCSLYPALCASEEHGVGLQPQLHPSGQGKLKSLPASPLLFPFQLPTHQSGLVANSDKLLRVLWDESRQGCWRS